MHVHAHDGGALSPEDPEGRLRETISPIDLEHLQRYTLSDRELEAELLGLFHTQSEHCLQSLRAAPNVNAWREAAHTLKGSAAGVGAFGVAEAAKLAERLAGGPGDPDAGRCLQVLEDRVRAAQHFIDAGPRRA